MLQKRRVGKKRKPARKSSRTKRKIKQKIPKDFRDLFSPGGKDLIVQTAKLFKGTCYSAVGCPGNLVIATSNTILECKAIGGKSWKGNWKPSHCIPI